MITEYSHDSKGKRNDIHAPRLIDPSNYELAAPLDSVNWWQRGPYVDNGKVGQICDHCGHSLRYYVLHIYKPTGEIVIFGEDCAALIGVADSRSALEFNKLRERARKDEREAKLAMVKDARRAQFTIQYPDLAEWLEDYAGDERMFFLNEMKRAFDFYGYLTLGQAQATQRIIAKRIEKLAAQIAEGFPSVPSPDGNATVTGTIIYTKLDDGMYGLVRKMMVKLDDGNKVFGTMPSSIENAIWGDNDHDFSPVGVKVTFTATFTPKKDDVYFSYYKRPTKGRVI